MNILFICDEYPPGRNGGIGTMVRVLGRELVKQGHKVHVAGLYGYRYGGKDSEIDNGVHVWRLRYGLNLGSNENNRFYNLLEKLPDVLKRYLNGHKAFEKYLVFLKDLIQNENIDVIEIPDWNMFSFYIGFPVKWPDFNAPLILKSNGSYTYFMDEAGEKMKAKFHDVDLNLYKRADALAAVSDYTAKKNKALFHLSRPVKVLYNSIEIPEITVTIKRQSQKIIYTGTLIKKKGVFQLAKAWNLVNEQFPEAELHIYGKGKITPILELLNERSKRKVFFKGHVTREELFAQLETATMAVFPSYSECFALAPLEAMAVGCPVVNTCKASGHELINDGENGSLIDPDRVNEMSQKIIELISNPELQEQYSKNGRETVRTRFNIVDSAIEHVAFYQEVAKNFR